MSHLRKPFAGPVAMLLFFITVSAPHAHGVPARGTGRRAQPAPALQPTRPDVAYGPHERHRIDFYQAQSEQATPLALYIHGGGFRGGSKQGINQATLRQLLDAGISVAAIEYRLVPEYPLPTAHRDSLRALQFIRTQAQAWHVDEQRIGAFGGSAGAQICMWLAFHDEMADPKSPDPIKHESSRLYCVATNGGQTTMDFSWWKQHIPGYDKPHRPRSEYFGDMDDNQLARTIRDISAQSLITADDPPIWMSYGMAPDAAIPSDPARVQGWKVHHVAFGVGLKQMMDELGIESHLKYPGQRTQYTSLAGFLVTTLRRDMRLAPLVRTVDLDKGQSQEVTLVDGSEVKIKLLDLRETRDPLCHAVREAQVTVQVNGESTILSAAMYHLPISVAGVQIDCSVTRGFVANSRKDNPWGLERDARIRLWPATSPWLRPGTFVYPVRQRWFASDTQMANEPVFVDGGDRPGKRDIYYHYGLDFGGAEGLVEVLAATEGRVVSAARETLPEHIDSPARARYDVIYVLDKRGWYYRYSHLKRIDVQAGQYVIMGQPLGLLGKEGGSGGWSHLHFDITSKQPSGQWGIQDAYAYAWEAYQREHKPPILAVARPHHLAALGQTVTLDARKSWSRSGAIKTYEWQLCDGTTKTGPSVEASYNKPGTYSEVLKVTDAAGHQAWDFAVVQVVDPETPEALPPSIHANYYPTQDLHPGDPVTFKVRSFRNTHGREVWDFGDGSPRVTVESDGNREVHSPDGYAVTQHSYDRAGHYLVSVDRSNQRGEKATAHLLVRVSDNIAGFHHD